MSAETSTSLQPETQMVVTCSYQNLQPRRLTLEHHFRRALMWVASVDFDMSMLEEFWIHSRVRISFNKASDWSNYAFWYVNLLFHIRANLIRAQDGHWALMWDTFEITWNYFIIKDMISTHPAVKSEFSSMLISKSTEVSHIRAPFSTRSNVRHLCRFWYEHARRILTSQQGAYFI